MDIRIYLAARVLAYDAHQTLHKVREPLTRARVRFLRVERAELLDRGRVLRVALDPLTDRVVRSHAVALVRTRNCEREPGGQESGVQLEGAAQVRGGALNAIVHSHAARLPDFPDVPTFKENGIDLVATTWFTISGPAKLPTDIVQKMNREIIRAVSKPEVQQRLRHDGMITEVMSVEQLKHYIDTETARWKPVLEQAGLIGN